MPVLLVIHLIMMQENKGFCPFFLFTGDLYNGESVCVQTNIILVNSFC